MILEVTDKGVTVPGEVIYTWAELARVSLVTTNPEAGTDAYFVLVTVGERRVMIPHNSAGASELLDHLQKLPGFDNEVFMQSLTSSEDAEFVLWMKLEPR